MVNFLCYKNGNLAFCIPFIGSINEYLITISIEFYYMHVHVLISSYIEHHWPKEIPIWHISLFGPDDSVNYDYTSSFIHLSNHSFIYLFILSSIHSSLNPFVYTSICLSTIHPSIHTHFSYSC